MINFELVEYEFSLQDRLAEQYGWDTLAIDYVDNPSGIFYVEHDLYKWVRHDSKHPRCWYCGKFVPTRRRWGWTGPCKDCDEPIGYDY